MGTNSKAMEAFENVVAGMTLKKAYLWSLALTLVLAMFAFDAMESVWLSFANDIGWLVFPLVPHMLAIGIGGAIGVAPGVALVGVVLFGTVMYVLGDVPKSIPRQHSHGEFVHSHKFDHSLDHYHNGKYPDRVYYR